MLSDPARARTQARALLGRALEGTPSKPEAGVGTACLYFAAPTAPPEPVLYLNGERESGGLVNNACFPSAVAPSYAPPGQARARAPAPAPNSSHPSTPPRTQAPASCQARARAPAPARAAAGRALSRGRRLRERWAPGWELLGARQVLRPCRLVCRAPWAELRHTQFCTVQPRVRSSSRTARLYAAPEQTRPCSDGAARPVGARQALVSVSTLGTRPELDDAALAAAAQRELGAWFGADAVAAWRLLRVYRIPFAQPSQARARCRAAVAQGLWQAGLWRAGLWAGRAGGAGQAVRRGALAGGPAARTRRTLPAQAAGPGPPLGRAPAQCLMCRTCCCSLLQPPTRAGVGAPRLHASCTAARRRGAAAGMLPGLPVALQCPADCPPLPRAQAPPTDLRRPVALGGGLFVCGDHRDSATLDGALASGRRAAEAVLAGGRGGAAAGRRRAAAVA